MQLLLLSPRNVLAKQARCKTLKENPKTVTEIGATQALAIPPDEYQTQGCPKHWYQSEAGTKISAQGTSPSPWATVWALSVWERLCLCRICIRGRRRGCGTSRPHPGPAAASSPRGPAGGGAKASALQGHRGQGRGARRTGLRDRAGGPQIPGAQG